MDGARDFIRMNVMYGFGCNARTCVDSAILAMSNKLDECERLLKRFVRA